MDCVHATEKDLLPREVTGRHSREVLRGRDPTLQKQRPLVHSSDLIRGDDHRKTINIQDWSKDDCGG